MVLLLFKRSSIALLSITLLKITKIWSFGSRIPRISKSTDGGRAFSHLALKLWNSLPGNLQGSDSRSQFSSRLKTHLFCQAFTWCISYPCTPVIRPNAHDYLCLMLWASANYSPFCVLSRDAGLLRSTSVPVWIQLLMKVSDASTLMKRWPQLQTLNQHAPMQFFHIS